MTEPAPHRRRALGRGLGALLSATPPAPPPAPGPGETEGDVLVEVALDDVAPNPEQPRRTLSEADLAPLAESIRLHGLLQPIVVEPREEGGYQLVAGERRLRAARLAGLRTVPAIVRPSSESARHALELALVENLQRTDLSPMEEAAAFARLADAFGLSHDAVARRVGRSRPAVSNAIRLLNLPPSLQEAVHSGRLSAGHARALLPLASVADQEALARRIEAEGLSVRQVEHLVATLLSDAARLAAASGPRGPSPSRTRGRPASVATAPHPHAGDAALRRGLEHVLGTPVRIERRRRGGRVIIDFFTDEQLDALYQRLGGPAL